MAKLQEALSEHLPDVLFDTINEYLPTGRAHWDELRWAVCEELKMKFKRYNNWAGPWPRAIAVFKEWNAQHPDWPQQGVHYLIRPQDVFLCRQNSKAVQHWIDTIPVKGRNRRKRKPKYVYVRMSEEALHYQWNRPSM
jgi:hypothetical protein